MMENNYKIIISRHMNDYYDQIKAIYDEESGSDSEQYLSYRLRDLFDQQSSFYVVGLLDNQVISTCYLQVHGEDNAYYLISDFITTKQYRHLGYGTKLIDYVITYLKEKNANRVGIFCESKESLSIVIKLGFEKKEEVKHFYLTTPGGYNAIYYEMRIPSMFHLSSITENSARNIGQLLENYRNTYECKIPEMFLATRSMWQRKIVYEEKFENQKQYSIQSGKLLIGYLNIYYEDYDYELEHQFGHTVYFSFILDNAYLFDDVAKLAINQAMKFYNECKKTHRIEKICMSRYWILPEQFDFYRRNLIKEGFRFANENEFIKE